MTFITQLHLGVLMQPCLWVGSIKASAMVVQWQSVVHMQLIRVM